MYARSRRKRWPLFGIGTRRGYDFGVRSGAVFHAHGAALVTGYDPEADLRLLFASSSEQRFFEEVHRRSSCTLLSFGSSAAG